MSKAGNFVIGTAIAGGAAAAIYFATKDKKKGSTDASGDALETTTTTTTTEVIEYDSPDALPANTQPKDSAAVAKSSGVKVNSPTSPFIMYEGAKLLKYETSADVPFVTRDSAPSPLNFLWKYELIIENFTPRLGLASDLDDMGAKYKSLGTIVSEGLIKNRRGNMTVIKDCLGMKSNESLDKRIDNNLRERMAILCRKVVEGAFNYWKWRADVLKEKNPEISIYELDSKGKRLKTYEGKDVKKVGAALAKAQEKAKNLYQLTDLDKQRIASNTLWAIVQLYDPNEKKVDTLNGCVDYIAKFNELRPIPVPTTNTEVKCPDRYFRAIVDAFFDGCFNCEVPNSEMVYWLQPNNKSNVDDYLAKRDNPTWLAGVLFYGLKLKTSRSI